MYSLFSKILLSFWLAALLLGGTMFALEGYLRGDDLRQAEQRLSANAEIVATLLDEGARPAVERWLGGLQRGGRPRVWLVDGTGRPYAGGRLPERLRERLELTPGTTRLWPDRFVMVATVPESRPPLYLVAVNHVGRAELIAPWVRLALAAMITGLVSFGLATVLTRRLRRLRAAAQGLASGNLNVRVDLQGDDEVAALGRDFDLMATRVRALLEAQRRLLSDVSHELRSPLARLKVALELARRKADPSVSLDRIEREADRLEMLLADVLSLARLESGQMDLNRTPVVLGELLAGIVQDADFEARARARGVTLTVDAPATLIGDLVLLRAALENVVRNAVRHTAEGSTVEVRLESLPGEALVTVRDHGEGVPDAELERLFEPFARVGEARDRASGGYGLGLAITRRAVTAHGGRVLAANAPDGGLVVTLRLPTRGPRLQ